MYKPSDFLQAPLATEADLKSSSPVGIYRVAVAGVAVLKRVDNFFDVRTSRMLHDILTLRVARVDRNGGLTPGVLYAGQRPDGCRVVIDEISAKEP